MKLLQFTYTKDNNDVSDRTVLLMQEPTKYIEGMDLSELDNDAFAEFVNKYVQLSETYRESQQQLFNEYELKHKYRRFIPDQMTDIETEYVC